MENRETKTKRPRKTRSDKGGTHQKLQHEFAGHCDLCGGQAQPEEVRWDSRMFEDASWMWNEYPSRGGWKHLKGC